MRMTQHPKANKVLSAPKGIVTAIKRPPVFYTVRIEQGEEGLRSVYVEDVAQDQRSRESIAFALREAAKLIEGGKA